MTEKILKIIEDEFDTLRDLSHKYEGTPYGYKYAHKMMAVRDLRNKIRRELGMTDLQHNIIRIIQSLPTKINDDEIKLK